MWKRADILLDVSVLQEEFVPIISTADEKESIRRIFLQILKNEFNVFSSETRDRILTHVGLFPLNNHFFIDIGEEERLEIFRDSYFEMWCCYAIITSSQDFLRCLKKVEHANLS